MSYIVFFIFAIISVVAALIIISSKNVVHSALSLILLFFCTSGLFILLKSELVAALQIFLYAGAIIVIYVFVIMMVDLRKGTDDDTGKLQKFSLTGVGIIFLGEILYFLSRADYLGVKDEYSTEKIISSGGSVKVIGEILFKKYLYPFEIISLVLLVAMIGAIVLAQKKKGRSGK